MKKENAHGKPAVWSNTGVASALKENMPEDTEEDETAPSPR